MATKKDYQQLDARADALIKKYEANVADREAYYAEQAAWLARITWRDEDDDGDLAVPKPDAAGGRGADGDGQGASHERAEAGAPDDGEPEEPRGGTDTDSHRK